MEGNEDEAVAASVGVERWTCEACGCNTNAASDRNCTICGTSHSGPSILRRAGGPAGYAARADWFARGLSGAGGARRVTAVAGIMGDELSLEDDDLWESVIHGVGEMGHHDHMEALAMDVGGNASRSRLVETSRQRFLEAARAFTQANREAQEADPEELLRAATANAASYQPHWANPATLVGARSPRSANGIEVGDGVERQNLAHLPVGAGEGRAIRAEEPLPRGDSGGIAFASFRMPPSNDNDATASNLSDDSPRRRAFGFRVAFDHPTTGDVTGANMGGCHLVGVTTSSFTAYSEQNSLQQSAFFWGIEDGGQKYEGSRHCSGRTAQRRSPGVPGAAAAMYAVELGATEAPMNAHSVLFGAREVITVVCDLDSRTLTFWRDETLLGTLVTNLPRSGNLYPVAVPFNCGVTVAITGLDNDPLPLLRTFATDWREVQQENDERIRNRLAKERAVLVQDGRPTTKLRNILKEIFVLYTGASTDQSEGNGELSLTYTMASRLWYRCGMKLASLDCILEAKEEKTPALCFQDFFSLIEQVIEEDEAEMQVVKQPPSDSTPPVSAFEVGDKVELVEGFERYGDAVGGPLQIGDRGVVVELQRGPNGEKRSVRVLHSGRRWWYQPQSILSERSGLIESPGIWFLSGLLRSHGYDHTTLETMVGKSVTPSSWRVGDIVASKNFLDEESSKMSATDLTDSLMIGRIAAETPGPSSSLAPHSRQSGTVIIEFVSRAFADAVGIKLTGLSPGSAPTLDMRRARITKLVHSTELHGSLLSAQTPIAQAPFSAGESDCEEDSVVMDDSGASASKSSKSPELLAASVSEKVMSEIEAVSRLDRSAIDSLAKECRKNSDVLASLFSAGLPDAIMSAISVAERQMNSLEPRDDLSERLAAIGDLANAITEQLFGESERTQEPDEMETESIGAQRPASLQNLPRNLRNRTSVVDRRLRARDSSSARREAGREDERGGESQGSTSSLQHRRNMLLSLLSRASRRSNAGAFLNDMAEAGIESLGQLPPPLAPMHRVPPFVFGPPNDLMDYDPQAMAFAEGQPGHQELPCFEDDQDSMPSREGASAALERKATILDSILRCHGDVSTAQLVGSLKQGGAAYAVFVRHLVSCGILADNVEWAKALVDGHSKKLHLASLQQRSSSMLRGVVDEEGTPLLLLAISLGCSADMIGRLIGWGATVGAEAIQKAATTNQPKTLSILLQHTSYKEGVVDLELCSSAVCRVLAHITSRQNDLDKRMRDAAGDFIVRLLGKLFEVGLSSRRTHTARIDMCSKVICEMLVGNVLLRAMQRGQKPGPDTSQAEHEADRDASDRNGRFAADDAESDKALLPQGLLGSLPLSVFGDFLFAKEGHVTTYLLLCEDYLCSKETADVAAGLTFLNVMLTKFPRLRSCSEMERFGMSEFVSNHNVLASNRIADILSKQFTIGLDVSASPDGTKDDSRLSPAQKLGGGGVVLCPKKHVAVLHITRHSSFRCDICGCAVPKGEYIFGCRQCDYDECLRCTLRDEKRTLGVQMMIRELATDCTRILFDSNEAVESENSTNCNGVVEEDARSDELLALSIRLLQRDVLAAKDLGVLLNESGRITIHEFLSVVLPALHASLVGHSKGGDGALVRGGAVHRNKKARASRSSTVDSPDVRLEYCREALRYMIIDPVDVTVKLSDAVAEPAAQEPGILIDPSEYVDVDDENEDAEENEEDEGGKVDISYSASASEILRRLHQILSFYESVQVFLTSTEKASGPSLLTNAGDLQALTKPIELQLSPSAFNDAESVSPKIRSVVYAEPLIPFADLQLHVLRTYKVHDPLYISFCQRLASDSAIIIERPTRKLAGFWRIASVEGFDERTGAHRVRYASGWKRGQERSALHIAEGSSSDFSFFRFYGPESLLVLAARQYYILYRKNSSTSPSETPLANASDSPMGETIYSDDPPNRLLQAIGTRVESNCGLDGNWDVLTLVGRDTVAPSGSIDGTRFVLVSDDGELHSGVSADQIRAQGSIPQEEPSRSRRPGRPGDDRNGLFPFFAARQRPDYPRGETESLASSSNQAKALKRSWSALSLIDDMRPVDLKVSSDTEGACGAELFVDLSLVCRLDDSEFQFLADASAVELPPCLCVLFSTHEKLAGVDLSITVDKTLVCALKELHEKQKKWSEWPPKPTCQLFFSVMVKSSDPAMAMVYESVKIKAGATAGPTFDSGVVANRSWPLRRENRSRKLSSRSLTSDDDDADDCVVTSLCGGIDEICVQCMEVISLLSECAEDPASPSDRDVLNLPGFANPNLSKKLSEQLDDVLCGVGAALPNWCLIAPSFAPHVFSYESRRMLLERAAFGPSRSTLKQQEAKVNVGRLRQRMTSLRARAVELVGEAFSGGAEDPTALQLQADELYGMEEALAARVRAAFRAVKWQEHSLQVAKAVVRRDRLLADAAAVMDSYTNDRSVCRRRLEVRFDGESGFDAASGDEAGVTRGFYADVAEALLSVENVAGVCCSSSCARVASTASVKQIQPMDIKEIEDEALKLPLWIPDMDSSVQVILPTPRADKRSGLGVFPRPLPQYHPKFDEVLQKFRFMGRLFAAAMRDGFMFPLPLSTAFLKLVQKGSDTSAGKDALRTSTLLLSSDLPRPGFLGGEVYAADYHICRALDRLDSADPPLSRQELKRRYEEIANDKKFARVAFGRSYDCSFDEYFQDRTFVDPLDPAQDADAVPLCPKGHAKAITIYNIREWVALAKNFMLHDGVIEQALAFRSGVDDFFSADYLRVFTSEELQRDVCGVGDDVDNWTASSIRKLFKLDGGKGAAEALVAVAAIGGEGGAALSRRFGPSSPTIAFLVKALVEASPKQRRQFLSFVTSVPLETKAGRIEVVPILSPSGEFLPMRDPSCLPRANTCSRRLYLPKFETFESFSDVLWAVVREESKFKGFYEWRGN